MTSPVLKTLGQTHGFRIYSVWIFCAVGLYVIETWGRIENGLGYFLVECLTPLFISSLVLLFGSLCGPRLTTMLAYMCFFSVSLASVFGYAETLTGKQTSGANAYLYGLAFYTAALCYVFLRKPKDAPHVGLISNPLVGASGPVVYRASRCRRGIKVRISYFGPYIVVGLFMHQIISAPLSALFLAQVPLNISGGLLYAVIFELFVYMNFGGISLMIYGVLGALGFRVPLNFRQPFSSRNIIEFWKGWHLSLSAVLKVAFYNPIRSKFGLLAGVFCVYLASAVWHGVTANFIIWGGFHASVYYLTVILARKERASMVSRFLLTLLLLVGVVVGRMIFMEGDAVLLLARFSNFRADMEGFGVSRIAAASLQTKAALVLGFCFVLAEILLRAKPISRRRNYKWCRLQSVQIVLFFTLLFGLVTPDGGDYAVYGQR